MNSPPIGFRILLTLMLFPSLFAGCARHQAASRDASLFEALGGIAGIERIVDGLLLQVVEDPRIAHHFAEANILRLREKLIEQLCEESGGPCTYTGDSMQASHAGRGYLDADFNALVECLQAAMESEGLPFQVQNRLLAKLAPMRDEVIGRPTRAASARAGG
jgi:hemoglobin